MREKRHDDHLLSQNKYKNYMQYFKILKIIMVIVSTSYWFHAYDNI